MKGILTLLQVSIPNQSSSGNSYKTVQPHQFFVFYMITPRTDVVSIFGLNCLMMIPWESKQVALQNVFD